MLSYISVKNFAIIENIEVEFKNGMTSLTGETLFEQEAIKLK